ncbi:3-oxoacyl-ACP synthase [Thiomonas sp. X19]|uniref:beta-ketoacyl synthase N-terminal-like domain-containing protein n=1 Tax=Thiomonas sp. X19 TaxID=1050370 RepID=UPI000B697DFA|nr:beta-ketoacyl synthase N-terminal-like domain-containing protein [Thiomonas sp. X19]SCC93165.1 3-oxoacyl-ACP synthase [Thiomonas sp. X19]
MNSAENHNRIAVTGLAWHTALGDQLAPVWAQLLAGRTGLAPVPSDYPLRNELAAALPTRDAPEPPKYKIRRITRSCVEAAARDAGLDLQAESSSCFIVVGTSFGARLDDEQASCEPLDQWVQEALSGLAVTPVSLSTACSSAADAILIGAQLLRAGVARRCICGGADILGESKRLAHSALGTMSPTLLRSFDQRHDGTLLGEGSGFVVLERVGERGGAVPYVLLRGCGSANDAAGLTAPAEQGEGIRLAIQRSLQDAKLDTSRVGLINAHGSGTFTNDRVESKAYRAIFHASQPTVFATKGAFGHSLGATGALEAIALILALAQREVPPIHALEQPLQALGLPVPVGGRPLATQADIGLSLTIGFGGFNTSLVFERTEHHDRRLHA